MKIIRLTELQIFNSVAHHKNEDHVVSDSVAELAARRGVLDGPAREYVPSVEASATESADPKTKKK